MGEEIQQRIKVVILHGSHWDEGFRWEGRALDGPVVAVPAPCPQRE